MAFLTKEQKDALGIWLGILIFIGAVVGGTAVYHLTGGERIPFLSDVSPIILGVVAAMLIHKSLSK